MQRFDNPFETYDGSHWHTPKRVDVIEKSDSIEVIYTQRESVYIDWQGSQTRVFKIVYSVVDGKWNKSKPIFGKIVPAQNEAYSFE